MESRRQTAPIMSLQLDDIDSVSPLKTAQGMADVAPSAITARMLSHTPCWCCAIVSLHFAPPCTLIGVDYSLEIRCSESAFVFFSFNASVLNNPALVPLISFLLGDGVTDSTISLTVRSLPLIPVLCSMLNVTCPLAPAHQAPLWVIRQLLLELTVEAESRVSRIDEARSILIVVSDNDPWDRPLIGGVAVRVCPYGLYRQSSLLPCSVTSTGTPCV